METYSKGTVSTSLKIIYQRRGGEDNGGNRGKSFSGTSVKDIWTKPKRGRITGRKWGWLGWGGVRGEQMETTVLEQQFFFKVLKNLPVPTDLKLEDLTGWGGVEGRGENADSCN